MKVIIAGSRHGVHPLDVYAAIKESGFEITEVVSGGAMGVDSLGEAWARQEGIPIKQFIPDWDRIGKAAGFARNRDMAKYGDALILVWDGESRGSAQMKKMAGFYHLPIHERVVTGSSPCGPQSAEPSGGSQLPLFP
jgi:hypothetical protein